MQTHINTILDFWFGELDESGMSAAAAHSLWFAASDATDETCRSRFGPMVEQALAKKLSTWTGTDSGLMALIILLDQMTRNIYRGTANAFSGDNQARRLALEAIRQDRHLSMPLIHRVFLYLPLEHSEDLAMQEQCVALFDGLAAETDLPQMKSFRQYAIAHRDVIAQFGRFPHRNTALGRKSSAAELNYLANNKGF